ncbi:MAG: bifunctional homocysteine S-methyltransferase/methylenetetrahydrofolate reductase [Verrucomicrobiota bacterium]|nr:bifunctional homocysteine S-methyltransferase/methylenetetrahydrofolate reductase [Verrucomicrobiota bacterium]
MSKAKKAFYAMSSWSIKMEKQKMKTLKNKDFDKALKSQVLIFDGAMGTEIYRRDVFINVCFDGLNLSSPDLIRAIYNDYLEAGADVITTNSFGANRAKLSKFGMADKIEQINKASVKLARDVIEQSEIERKIYIAGSVGPVPHKNIDSDEAIKILREQIKILIDAGVDVLIFETMPSREDLSLCYRAMYKFEDFPFILSVTVDENNESVKGEPLKRLVAPFMGEKPNHVAWGINCSVGPESMLSSVETVIKALDLPLIVQPNAGTPRSLGNRKIYMCSPEYIMTYSLNYIELGVRGVGGCCGTTPKHIKEIADAVKPLTNKTFTVKKHIDINHLELLEPKELAERSELGRKLTTGEWITSIEITPPRGYDLSRILEKATFCGKNNINAINIPDGPRASSRMSPMITAEKILNFAGIEPILHFCCRDRNLIGMQSDLLGCAAAGIKNILFVTGDPPKHGDYPFASGVFDADAIDLVQIQNLMNRGVDIGKKKISPPTECVIGVGVNPDAVDMQRELKRFREKIEVGAEFAISQPVFDPEAIYKFLEEMGENMIPFIAGIWPLVSYRNAAFMKHEVPGVYVPDELMKRMKKYEKKEDQLKEGLQIAKESIDAIHNCVQGIQVSAPFGKVEIALQVIGDKSISS